MKEAVKKVVLGSKKRAETPSDDKEEYEEESPVKKKARVRGTIGIANGKVPLAVQPCW